MIYLVYASLIVALLVLFALIGFFFMKSIYNQSTYKKETNQPFLDMLSRTARIKGCFTTNKLDKMPGTHKVLVNVHVPNKSGGTSLIDILFVHETGIYVINMMKIYGWISGNEKESQWTKTLKQNKKELFDNPIKENEGRIEELKKLLPTVPENQFKSIINFSEECLLIKIETYSERTFVCREDKLKGMIKKETNQSFAVFTKEQIDEIYNTLKPYCKVS
ncbi:hypothetical protein CVD28_02290 [Bacillus sp. M6-12]|uniref:nuclease-related domain-containing protein n=1 Tax=Bacillus sp. M6-12 TaxID=2054166 RepID=UPI000C795420|nr:nuclease-related domain-containing protein [Bacillus sp. M6-12]PLS19262.1 hypothetical protein CVD28_02290 [Bacillus sp. M6-12]